ncbi:hypothetical protein, partial [Rhizobium ruizarguesonis]|uniref:hypothetical protein n=1 Tax=Rhizobium ruizarguesonis TaxID=2081791 RepID=UPI001A8BFDF4
IISVTGLGSAVKITPSRLSRPPSLPGLKRWSHQPSSALDASAYQTGSAIESAPLTPAGVRGAKSMAAF